MIAADPLFGPIDIPAWLDSVLLTPEVQRLREVRLINTTTPHLAALSDTRRYTHTVGVLALALRVAPRLTGRFSREEIDGLLIAAVLHDVGTPPFAHLFEYLLKADSGWTHEGMLKNIVAGSYRPEGRYHQLYFGNELALHKVLKSRPAETEIALGYVEGRGPLASLIAGSLDLDNIDNVYRMCSLLGFRPDLGDALRLVDGIGVGSEGPQIEATALDSVESWRRWRRKAYEILAFDESSLQGQAMLTDALSFSMENGLLSEEQWSMTDEQLLTFLFGKGRQFPNLRTVIQRFSIGDFYRTVFTGWYDVRKSEDDLRLPARREALREALESRLHYSVCPYVFYDNGTFEKELLLSVHSRGGSASRVIGSTSSSTVVSVFTPRRRSVTKGHREKVIQVLEDFGLRYDKILPIPSKQSVYEFPGETQLPF